MKMKCSVIQLIFIELAIILIHLSFVQNDLPVHCLADKIEGKFDILIRDLENTFRRE
jgi:hypothetical protein